MISDSLRLPHKRMMIIIIITHHIIVTFNSPTMHLNSFISFGAARVATQRERQRHSAVLRADSRRRKRRLMPLAVEQIAHDFLIPRSRPLVPSDGDWQFSSGRDGRPSTLSHFYLIRAHSTCSAFRWLARAGGCRCVATWQKQLGYQ